MALRRTRGDQGADLEVIRRSARDAPWWGSALLVDHRIVVGVDPVVDDPDYCVEVVVDGTTARLLGGALPRLGLALESVRGVEEVLRPAPERFRVGGPVDRHDLVSFVCAWWGSRVPELTVEVG